MRKWMLIGVAALGGVVSAFLLLPSPDTGAAVADLDRAGRLEAAERAGPKGSPVPPVPKAVPSGRVTRGGEGVAKDPGVGVKGASELAAAGVERRSQPDAVTAGRASAPWSLIRRQILRNEDEFSKEVVLPESAELIAELRKLRRDPESVDFDALEKRQLALSSRIRGSDLAQNTEILGALDRLDELLASYHEQINNTPAP